MFSEVPNRTSTIQTLELPWPTTIWAFTMQFSTLVLHQGIRELPTSQADAEMMHTSLIQLIRLEMVEEILTSLSTQSSTNGKHLLSHLINCFLQSDSASQKCTKKITWIKRSLRSFCRQQGTAWSGQKTSWMLWLKWINRQDQEGWELMEVSSRWLWATTVGLDVHAPAYTTTYSLTGFCMSYME